MRRPADRERAVLPIAVNALIAWTATYRKDLGASLRRRPDVLVTNAAGVRLEIVAQRKRRRAHLPKMDAAGAAAIAVLIGVIVVLGAYGG